MKKQTLVLAILILMISACKKDENSNKNSTSETATPVFNSNVIYGTETDQDGNSFKTVLIGSQTWMAENLRVTTYNDGSTIPNVIIGSKWANLSTGAYCNYNNTNNSDSIKTYGRLYNWYTVETGRICPKGWHVPSITEWDTLEIFLANEGDESIKPGGKLKENGNFHWYIPNSGTTNSSGFTALPGGWRIDAEYEDGTNGFGCIGYSGFWWSTSEASFTSDERILIPRMDCDTNYLNSTYYYKNSGVSIRCLKD